METPSGYSASRNIPTWYSASRNIHEGEATNPSDAGQLFTARNSAGPPGGFISLNIANVVREALVTDDFGDS